MFESKNHISWHAKKTFCASLCFYMKLMLAGVAKHNLRQYKSEEYSADNIFLIYGTDNLVQDVKAVYHQEFDEALKVYKKSNQSRT